MLHLNCLNNFFKLNFIIITLVIMYNFQLFAGNKDAEIESHGHHNHHAASFIGFTSNPDAGHTDFTFGLDYEYRLPFLHQQFGVGAVAEIVFAEHKETIVAASLYYHPFGDLKFNLSAGYVFTDVEHVDPDHHDSHITETEKHFLTRIGTAYDFHVSGFSFGPAFNLDFIEGHTVMVFGVSFGKGF